MSKIKSINPATEEIVAEYEAATISDLNAAVDVARKTFAAWKGVDIKERAALMLKLEDVYKRRADEFAKLITVEMGKPIKESTPEIEKCGWLMRYYAENGPAFLADEPAQTEAKRSFIAFEPLGVVGIIMPWNFPFWQVLRCAVPAIVAGNVVILRHSSTVPGCALAIQETFEQAGFPKGVFTTMVGDTSIAEAMIDHPGVNAVSLTGSVETGRKVAERAGRGLKKFVLELGGSDPFIVLEDADIDATCSQAARGRLLNCGQSCIAAKRFIVVKDIAKEFAEKFVESVRGAKVGDPLDPETDVGPLVNKTQLEKLESQVNDAAGKGARILVGGKRIQGKGYFFEPTVVDNVKPEMRIYHEEIFGPAAPIIVVKDEEEAIKVANETDFGLGASVWTNDLKRAENILRNLEAGIVYSNHVVRSDPRMPFGGTKKSGIGRELSRYGILEFTNIKSILIF